MDWNPTAESLFGYTRQEAIGRHVTTLLTPEHSRQATSTWLNQRDADPLFVKDQQHRYIVLNDPYCQFMGWNRAEVIGLNDHDVFPDVEQADLFRTTDQLVLDGGNDREDEETLTNLHGGTHIFSTKKTCLHDASGNRFIVGTMRDITALNSLNQEVLRSHPPKATGLKVTITCFWACDRTEVYPTLEEQTRHSICRHGGIP